jgi:hypothetical protein
MPKKKHRKKARSSKRAAPRKATKHAKRPKGAKHSKHLSARAKPEGHSFSLLRAIKRRRAAERGKHPETHAINGTSHHARKGSAAHHVRKVGTGHHVGKRSHHHVEPVVTEKSFENMLAFRRFQNHAR